MITLAEEPLNLKKIMSGGEDILYSDDGNLIASFNEASLYTDYLGRVVRREGGEFNFFGYELATPVYTVEPMRSQHFPGRAGKLGPLASKLLSLFQKKI